MHKSSVIHIIPTITIFFDKFIDIFVNILMLKCSNILYSWQIAFQNIKFCPHGIETNDYVLSTPIFI